MMSKPLTFKELCIGDKFIGFPSDGDDSGHGGFRKGSYIFEKESLTATSNSKFNNAKRMTDGNRSFIQEDGILLKVIL